MVVKGFWIVVMVIWIELSSPPSLCQCYLEWIFPSTWITLLFWATYGLKKFHVHWNIKAPHGRWTETVSTSIKNITSLLLWKNSLKWKHSICSICKFADLNPPGPWDPRFKSYIVKIVINHLRLKPLKDGCVHLTKGRDHRRTYFQ